MSTQAQILLEKRFPLIASVLLHVALLVFLMLHRVDINIEKPQRAKPILMHVLMPPPPPSPAPAPSPSPAQPTQAQQTTPNPSEELNPEAATAPESDADQKEPAKADLPPIPPSPQQQKIASIDEQTLKEWKAQLREQESEQQARKSRLAELSPRADIASQGAERSYFSRGAKKGVIREIDIEGYPESVQQRFMRRYKIKVVRKLIRKGSGSTYLNAVKTDDGAYLNQSGSGYGEVMILSKQVLARMATLEETELLKRDLDPLRTRVLEVVFGLEEDGRGMVDLGIKRFRAEPIE